MQSKKVIYTKAKSITNYIGSEKHQRIYNYQVFYNRRKIQKRGSKLTHSNLFLYFILPNNSQTNLLFMRLITKFKTDCHFI